MGKIVAALAVVGFIAIMIWVGQDIINGINNVITAVDTAF